MTHRPWRLFGISLVIAIAAGTLARWLGSDRDIPHGRFSDRHWGLCFGSEGARAGETIERTLDWNYSDSFTTTLAADVDYEPAERTSAVARGPRELIDHLSIANGQLRDDRRWWNQCSGGRATITLRGPAITHWTLLGVGQLDLEKLHQSRLDLELNGTGRIRAGGAADSVVINIQGTGLVDLRSLAAGDVDASLVGVGRADLAPTGTARINIVGPGAVMLWTRPRSLTTNVVGPGRIEYAASPGDQSTSPQAGRQDDIEL